MIPAPRGFSSSNDHRIVVFQQPTSEFEQLEDTLADALGAARSALNERHLLDFDVFKPLQRSFEFVEEQVDKGRLLNDVFHVNANAIVEALSQVQAADVSEFEVAVLSNMQRAAKASIRVADLIAAEKDINWHRSQRR